MDRNFLQGVLKRWGIEKGYYYRLMKTNFRHLNLYFKEVYIYIPIEKRPLCVVSIHSYFLHAKLEKPTCGKQKWKTKNHSVTSSSVYHGTILCSSVPFFQHTEWENMISFIFVVCVCTSRSAFFHWRPAFKIIETTCICCMSTKGEDRDCAKSGLVRIQILLQKTVQYKIYRICLFECYWYISQWRLMYIYIYIYIYICVCVYLFILWMSKNYNKIYFNYHD